jgi:hypothetical protein
LGLARTNSIASGCDAFVKVLGAAIRNLKKAIKIHEIDPGIGRAHVCDFFEKIAQLLR